MAEELNSRWKLGMINLREGKENKILQMCIVKLASGYFVNHNKG